MYKPTFLRKNNYSAVQSLNDEKKTIQTVKLNVCLPQTASNELRKMAPSMEERRLQ